MCPISHFEQFLVNGSEESAHTLDLTAERTEIISVIRVMRKKIVNNRKL